jgi:hypothetical protein
MKKIVVITLLALSTVSCKKFLEERSQTDVIPKTTKDFGEILYSNGYPTSVIRLQPYINLMDDDLQCYNGPMLADQQATITGNAGAFQWQPDFIDVCDAAGSADDETFNSWKIYYQLLLGANVALQYMDNSIGNTTEKTMYKGEAYALRAFYHFMLVNLYAKPYNDSTTTPDQSPGIPLRLSANLSEQLLARNTVKEVYTQVTKDLDSAIYLLEQGKSDQKLFRINHVAAHLLASRVYLYMEDWEKAIAHADYVLDYHPQLMDLNEWGGVPDPDNKPILGLRNIETIWSYGHQSESFPDGTGSGYDISTDLASCYDNNDLRNGIYYIPVTEFLKDYVASDFLYYKLIPASGLNVDLGSSWRSAEAYLNRAEACIQLYKTKGDAGAATQALNSLNTLRAKRINKSSFTNWTLQPADKLLTMCRTERRRELVRECGHRWFDLRRYGMPAIKHIYAPGFYTTAIYELAKHDPQYVLPIPNEVLLRNMSLRQNQQIGSLRLPR